MPRGVLRAKGVLEKTDSGKLRAAAGKPAAKDVAMPHHSQSGLTKVNLVPHSALDGFSPSKFDPAKFAKGELNRMYGVAEHIVSNTMADTHPVKYRSENLRLMVESTMGDAYDLANSGVLRHTVGASHRDSIEKGTGGIGPVKTQPMRYGQVPFGGPQF